MAFSLRKIMSNIGYFKKPDGSDESGCQNDPDFVNKQRNIEASARDGEIFNIDFESTEPDSTSIQNSSFHMPAAVKNFSTKKGSLSDTDLLKVNTEKSKKSKKRSKKLKLDIKKANRSLDEGLNVENVENTPKHVHLECKSSEIFSERMKLFDFSKSFELDSENSSFEEEHLELESLSEDDISLASDDKTNIPLCRKVTESTTSDEIQMIPSASPESFGDVEVDKNEDQRLVLLMNYQEKFEKMEGFLKKLLTDFQFHVEVSKIFDSETPVGLAAIEENNIPKLIEEAMSIENLSCGFKPAESWNMLNEKQDDMTKHKLKNQLLSIQYLVNEFVNTYMKHEESKTRKMRPFLSKNQRSITFDVHTGNRLHKQRFNSKKKIKHFDFPDIRDAMINLFSTEDLEVTKIIPEVEASKCACNCHESQSETDSGLKEDRSMSITSSIGNFTLDSTTLSAYSESLDQVISYNSFEDSSLYCTLLQKAAIERITFYVQVHSIQIKCEHSEDFESKNSITFHCPSCKTTDNEENSLLKHIFSQYHCEKIHFLYKTAYIKKCVKIGKEIQPSTVLNPMKMYRDDNKIVCFGDAMYACSLCFENLIVGESVLMAHIMEDDHVDRRERLSDILD